VDVWLTASSEPESGIAATATRLSLTGRWKIEIDPIHGAGALGHELFHVRYHDRMRDWPAILEEGLADRFGFTGDPFSDSVATDRLFAAARRRPPRIELTFEMSDGTSSGTHTRIFPDDSAPPPLSLQRIGALSRWELRRLSTHEHAYVYGVGYAVALRWLGSGPLPPFSPAPRWSEIAPSSSDELERWAASQLDPVRVRGWAIGRLAFDVVTILENVDRSFASPDDCLGSLAFRLSIDEGESLSLNEEPAFRELLQWIWPIVTARREGSSHPDVAIPP
jgi:hypothetical protein